MFPGVRHANTNTQIQINKYKFKYSFGQKGCQKRKLVKVSECRWVSTASSKYLMFQASAEKAANTTKDFFSFSHEAELNSPLSSASSLLTSGKERKEYSGQISNSQETSIVSKVEMPPLFWTSEQLKVFQVVLARAPAKQGSLLLIILFNPRQDSWDQYWNQNRTEISFDRH